MTQREAFERNQVRRALQADYDLAREDERTQVRLAELEAMEAKLRRIAALYEEIAPNSASFPGKVQSRTHSEG